MKKENERNNKQPWLKDLLPEDIKSGKEFIEEIKRGDIVPRKELL